MKVNFKSVDAYITSFPEDIQVILSKIRGEIIKNAPESIEKIAYGMPAYTHA